MRPVNPGASVYPEYNEKGPYLKDFKTILLASAQEKRGKARQLPKTEN
jgi:hypothetical protein